MLALAFHSPLRSGGLSRTRSGGRSPCSPLAIPPTDSSGGSSSSDSEATLPYSLYPLAGGAVQLARSRSTSSSQAAAQPRGEPPPEPLLPFAQSASPLVSPLRLTRSASLLLKSESESESPGRPAQPHLRQWARLRGSAAGLASWKAERRAANQQAVERRRLRDLQWVRQQEFAATAKTRARLSGVKRARSPVVQPAPRRSLQLTATRKAAPATGGGRRDRRHHEARIQMEEEESETEEQEQRQELFLPGPSLSGPVAPLSHTTAQAADSLYSAAAGVSTRSARAGLLKVQSPQTPGELPAAAAASSPSAPKSSRAASGPAAPPSHLCPPPPGPASLAARAVAKALDASPDFVAHRKTGCQCNFGLGTERFGRCERSALLQEISRGGRTRAASRQQQSDSPTESAAESAAPKRLLRSSSQTAESGSLSPALPVYRAQVARKLAHGLAVQQAEAQLEADQQAEPQDGRLSRAPTKVLSPCSSLSASPSPSLVGKRKRRSGQSASASESSASQSEVGSQGEEVHFFASSVSASSTSSPVHSSSSSSQSASPAPVQSVPCSPSPSPSSRLLIGRPLASDSSVPPAIRQRLLAAVTSSSTSEGALAELSSRRASVLLDKSSKTRDEQLRSTAVTLSRIVLVGHTEIQLSDGQWQVVSLASIREAAVPLQTRAGALSDSTCTPPAEDQLDEWRWWRGSCSASASWVPPSQQQVDQWASGLAQQAERAARGVSPKSPLLCKLYGPFPAPWDQLNGLYARLQLNNVAVQINPNSQVGKQLDFRLVANRNIGDGEAVTHYGGIPVHTSEYKAGRLGAGLEHTHARSLPGSDYVLDGLPFASMLTRPTPRSAEELEQLQLQGMEPLWPTNRDHTGLELGKFMQTPMGFLVNTAGPGQANNVGIAWVRLVGNLHMVPVLHALRAIREGEELLCPYNNEEQRRIRRRAATADLEAEAEFDSQSSSDSPASASRSPVAAAGVYSSASSSAPTAVSTSAAAEAMLGPVLCPAEWAQRSTNAALWAGRAANRQVWSSARLACLMQPRRCFPVETVDGLLAIIQFLKATQHEETLLRSLPMWTSAWNAVRIKGSVWQKMVSAQRLAQLDERLKRLHEIGLTLEEWSRWAVFSSRTGTTPQMVQLREQAFQLLASRRLSPDQHQQLGQQAQSVQSTPGPTALQRRVSFRAELHSPPSAVTAGAARCTSAPPILRPTSPPPPPALSLSPPQVRPLLLPAGAHGPAIHEFPPVSDKEAWGRLRRFWELQEESNLIHLVETAPDSQLKLALDDDLPGAEEEQATKRRKLGQSRTEVQFDSPAAAAADSAASSSPSPVVGSEPTSSRSSGPRRNMQASLDAAHAAAALLECRSPPTSGGARLPGPGPLPTQRTTRTCKCASCGPHGRKQPLNVFQLHAALQRQRQRQSDPEERQGGQAAACS